jgi:hypothetical protein
MAGLDAWKIRDRSSFKAWLEALSETERREAAVALAHRAALRIIPLLGSVWGYYNKVLDEVDSRKFVTVGFWRIMIARSARSWPDEELSNADIASGSSYFGVSKANLEAERAADAIAFAATSATTNHSDYVGAATAAANFSVERSDALRSFKGGDWYHIAGDAALIEKGTKGFALYGVALWTREVPIAWRLELTTFSESLNAGNFSQEGWDIWLDWYGAIVEGLLAFGLKDRKIAEALERAIALGGKNGKFHEEFWKRTPGEINRDIAEWVAEARIAEALQIGQGGGLRFQVRNGLIGLGRYLGMNAPSDDRKRIEINLPQLSELAELLKSALDAREAPYPALLLKTLDRFATLVKSPPVDIEPDHLFAAASLLRGQIESAAKPSANSNAPPKASL